MPSKNAISATLLNASYKLAMLTYGNYQLVQSGKLPVQEEYINYFQLNLTGLQYQYDNSLYTTTTTITLYNRVNNLIGLPKNIIIDSNFQSPNSTIVIEGPGLQPIEFTILAGTAIPYNYSYILTAQPDVTFLISNGSGLTSYGTTNITYNLVGGVMSIYGNNDGINKFNEDTYVRIQP